MGCPLKFVKALKGHLSFEAPYRVNEYLWSMHLSPNSPPGKFCFLPFSSKVFL